MYNVGQLTTGIVTLGSLLLSGMISLTSLNAWADPADNQTSVKVESVKPAEATDDLLTNNKLRAETGSTSRWSVATSLQYVGGSISRPFSDYRPNIQNVNGQSPVADIDGGINVKLNLTKADSLFLGETVRFITPLTSAKSTPEGYKGQKIDSFNPGLTYQHIYKVANLQSYYQFGPNIITQTDYTKIGYLGNVNLYNVNSMDIGQSRFTIGLESGATYGWFRTPQAYPEVGESLEDTKKDSSDWNLFVYPTLEYKINDKLNLRTVGMWFSVEHTLFHSGDYQRWTKDVAMQSVGLGISVSRDVFLYPNIQFVPDQLRGKQTNVALSTNINVF